jgi:hypothetical protein
MTKQKKKRNKVYTGADAVITRPVVTRISATNRNKVSQWWFDRKTFLKPILITSLVVIVVVWLIIELFRIINGA